MACYRIFTGVDGRSRFERLAPERIQRLLEAVPAVRFYLKEFPAGTLMDYHPAPQRMVVVVLGGVLESSFSDGSNLQVGAGDLRLMEDDGATVGHRTRVVGPDPVLLAVTVLPSSPAAGVPAAGRRDGG